MMRALPEIPAGPLVFFCKTADVFIHTDKNRYSVFLRKRGSLQALRKTDIHRRLVRSRTADSLFLFFRISHIRKDAQEDQLPGADGRRQL